MYRLSLCLLSLLFLLACGSNAPSPSSPTVVETPNIDLNRYPTGLQIVFAKHGGLEVWSRMKSMSYEIVKPEQNEKQMIHLKDRRERIEGADFKTGYDGKNIWLEADTTYKGNAPFYHNLMFYFYAMPFVVADDGIIYSETKPLEFDGKSYPGVRISYEDTVGGSPKDEYFIHYDPATNQMAWLGYTVTYFSKEKSAKISWIRYDDWKTFNGLVLPKSITWFKSEEGKLTEARNTVEFDKIVVTEKAMDDSTFEKTAEAKVLN